MPTAGGNATDWALICVRSQSPHNDPSRHILFLFAAEDTELREFDKLTLGHNS